MVRLPGATARLDALGSDRSMTRPDKTNMALAMAATGLKAAVDRGAALQSRNLIPMLAVASGGRRG